jgi:cyclopropane fatty-acyl-phospholipid synthase-like methyltransferase
MIINNNDLMNKLKRIKRRILSWLLPSYVLRQQQENWNKKWSNPSFDPAWRISEIPKELQEAVESEWFPPKASVLDIGCGSGEVSTWLAEQGFTVLGIDIAEGAVQKARSCAADKRGKLSFQTLDICRQSTTPQQFEIFIDRGCLHTIDPRFTSNYVKHVAASCTQGARFLLLHKVMPREWSRGGAESSPNTSSLEELQKITTDRIERYFCPMFEILKIKPIVITRASGAHPKDPMPGLAIRMIRSKTGSTR